MTDIIDEQETKPKLADIAFDERNIYLYAPTSFEEVPASPNRGGR